MKRVGFWRRLLAGGIDLVALGVLWVGVGAVGMGLGERWMLVVCYLAVLAYSSSEVWAGGTLGKWVCGLVIACSDGRPGDFWTLCLRWSTKWLSVLAWALYGATGFGVFYLLGGFEWGVVVIGCFFAANDDKLAWHDQWAHTAVFRREEMKMGVRRGGLVVETIEGRRG